MKTKQDHSARCQALEEEVFIGENALSDLRTKMRESQFEIQYLQDQLIALRIELSVAEDNGARQQLQDNISDLHFSVASAAARYNQAQLETQSLTRNLQTTRALASQIGCRTA